jgi:triosephosphate isomerase (TIM)
MTRIPLIAGNWKMHTTIATATSLARKVAEAAADRGERQVMLAPPFTALAAVAEAIRDSGLILAAQNLCWAPQGAFTGEISPLMLKEVGGSMAILGHSERRQLFGETDELINRRVTGALAHDITPILCLGEQLADREAGRTMAILERQLRLGLKEITLSDPSRLVIAYEPVWAIGTGRTASAAQAQEAHAFIRRQLGGLFEKNIASQIRILYGGSVNPDNIDTLMSQEDIDGALVGGAALQPDSFSRIIHFQ